MPVRTLGNAESVAYTRETCPVSQNQQLRLIQTRLSDTEDGPKHVEYRVYNWRKLESGRVWRGDAWGLGDVLVWVITAWLFMGLRAKLGMYAWSSVRALSGGAKVRACVLGLIVLVHTWRRCHTVLCQSVIPLQELGVQLSTTRGLSLPHPLRPRSPKDRLLIPIGTSYTFIPLAEISTVIINEGLRMWNVRFYLAVIRREGRGVVVALDQVWAPHAVLKEIYHGVRETLFDEYADAT